MGELKLRGRIWWIRYYRNGRRFEESAGSQRKGRRAALRLREGDIARGLPVSPKIGRLTFEDAAADVIADYQANGKRSLAVTARRIRKHLTPFFGGRRMAAITTSDVRAYIVKRQADLVVVRHAPRPVSRPLEDLQPPAHKPCLLCLRHRVSDPESCPGTESWTCHPSLGISHRENGGAARI